jgi:glycogen(starch) synthase
VNILQLGPVPPPHGGVQTHMMALRAFLRAHGHRTSVINITRHRSPETDDVYHPKSAGALLARVARLRPDIMHVHLGGNLGQRDLSLCLVLSAIPGGRVVLTFHSGGYPGSEAGRRAQPGSFAGFVLRRLDGLIGVNQAIVDTFHRFGVSPARTALIEPHAIDGGSLPSGTDAMPSALRAFAAAHRPFLVTVGLLEPEYSLELQIDCLPRIRERHPSVGLAIIGSGSLDGALRTRIAASPAREHIMLCGDVPHQGTLAAIRHAAALLRPTQYDGDSLSVREALAMGTPVLASNTGMRPAGVTLLSSLDPGGLMEGVSAVLGSPAGTSGADLGAGNLARVLELYERLT